MIAKLKNNNINRYKLTNYLYDVDKDFEAPLSSKVELAVYSLKLLIHGIVIVSMEDGEITALLAGYCNDIDNGNAIISLLSVRRDFRGKGLSRQLVKRMIAECKKTGMKKIYVDSVNPIAVAMYISEGFSIDRIESRSETTKSYLHFQL